MNQLIVAGGREIGNVPLIRREINQAWRDIGPFEVVSGTARGVDSIAADLAKQAGITVHEYPADWDRFGKSAGYRRNEQMASVATHLLAFWDGESKGTGHMIDIAGNVGVPARIIKITAQYKELV